MRVVVGLLIGLILLAATLMLVGVVSSSSIARMTPDSIKIALFLAMLSDFRRSWCDQVVFGVAKAAELVNEVRLKLKRKQEVPSTVRRAAERGPQKNLNDALAKRAGIDCRALEDAGGKPALSFEQRLTSYSLPSTIAALAVEVFAEKVHRRRAEAALLLHFGTGCEATVTLASVYVIARPLACGPGLSSLVRLRFFILLRGRDVRLVELPPAPRVSAKQPAQKPAERIPAPRPKTPAPSPRPPKMLFRPFRSPPVDDHLNFAVIIMPPSVRAANRSVAGPLRHAGKRAAAGDLPHRNCGLHHPLRIPCPAIDRAFPGRPKDPIGSRPATRPEEPEVVGAVIASSAGRRKSQCICGPERFTRRRPAGSFENRKDVATELRGISLIGKWPSSASR